jgi:hypothetical protein
MTFEGEYPETLDEFMNSWESLNAARISANEEVEAEIEAEQKAAQMKQKGKKKATPRKKRGAPRTGEEGDQEPAQETGEGIKPKRKGKGKAVVGKELKLSLDDALSRGNRLSTKTKDEEVNSIYKALEEGLGHAFLYEKWRLSGVIPSEKLHIAPDELKYTKIATAQLD